MTPRSSGFARPRRLVLGAAWLLGGILTLTGCVSTKYKMAPKGTVPAVALNLETAQPPIAVMLHTVIVYKGPGSWKKEAYWDEYVVSIANQSTAGLTVESATLVDALGSQQTSGSDPWKLEKISRQNLKKFEHYGRTIAIGAGMTAGWVFAGGATYAAAWAGETALATAAGAVFVALPVFAVGSGVRVLAARSSITDEFNRRRIALPLELKPGQTKQGSFFFPVSPGPERLVLRYRANETAQLVTLNLTPLAGLHFSKEVKQSAAGKAAKP